MKKLEIRNPYSGKLLNKVPFLSVREISSTVQASQLAFKKWKTSTGWERSQLLNHAASQLEAQKEEFANLICSEAGKPLALARAEVDRGVSVLRWAASEAQRFSGELLRLDAGAAGRPGFGIHTRFPKGVVLGITPFNFPLNLVLHKVAPAIACGCSILIKPSPFTPLTALKLAELFPEKGLVQVILADDEETAKLTRLPEIAMISFTGSAHVGWKIRKQAPEKPTALELGGNAWAIVMNDTPPEQFPVIAKRIANAAFGYAGQSCISVQNVAIAEDLWSSIHKELQQITESMPYGDPTFPGVVCGPLIHCTAANRVSKQLKQLPRESSHSSQNLKGNLKGMNPSNLMAPTLITLPENFKKNSTKTAPLVHSLVQEEIFAPVMIAHRFNKIENIVEQINSSRYGLQAGIFTQHWPTIERLYRDLEVGGLVVNDVPTTRYDHQPYGGVKDSGQGREGIRYAMDEMTDSKFLALSSQIPN